MRGTRQRFCCRIECAGVALILSLIVALALPQNACAQDTSPLKTGTVPIVGGFDKVKPLPSGGPAPRMTDGHVDLTGRWYPNAAGQMLQAAYPLDRTAFRQFDPQATPEQPPSFKPGMGEKYKSPVPYG